MDDGSFTNVNSRQVGGGHYAAAYQHWDFVVDAGLGYLDGNATKYLARWRKKNGRQDLHKACHYLEKAIERGQTPPRMGRSAYALLGRFCESNEVPAEERAAMAFIVHGDYENALVVVRKMIAELP